MPHEIAAVLALVLCHFMQSHVYKVCACLTVTCHLHFWQNDRDLLCATEVIWGWNGYRNKSTESWPWRRKFSWRSCRDLNPRPFNHESGALTTELSLDGSESVKVSLRSRINRNALFSTHSEIAVKFCYSEKWQFDVKLWNLCRENLRWNCEICVERKWMREHNKIEENTGYVAVVGCCCLYVFWLWKDKQHMEPDKKATLSIIM